MTGMGPRVNVRRQTLGARSSLAVVLMRSGKLQRFGTLGKRMQRHIERKRQSPHGSPGRILSSALEVRDPGRMQRSAVGDFFLAEPPLET